MTTAGLLAEGHRRIDGRSGTCASCDDFERLVPVHLPHVGPGLLGVRAVCSLCAGVLSRSGLAERLTNDGQARPKAGAV